MSHLNSTFDPSSEHDSNINVENTRSEHMVPSQSTLTHLSPIRHNILGLSQYIPCSSYLSIPFIVDLHVQSIHHQVLDTNTHHMVERFKSGICKPKLFHASHIFYIILTLFYRALTIIEWKEIM